jgi:hypothetical protein
MSRHSRHRRQFIGAGCEPHQEPQQLGRDQRAIDSEYQIQLGSGHRQRGVDSGQRPACRVEVFHHRHANHFRIARMRSHQLDRIRNRPWPAAGPCSSRVSPVGSASRALSRPMRLLSPPASTNADTDAGVSIAQNLTRMEESTYASGICQGARRLHAPPMTPATATRLCWSYQAHMRGEGTLLYLFGSPLDFHADDPAGKIEIQCCGKINCGFATRAGKRDEDARLGVIGRALLADKLQRLRIAALFRNLKRKLRKIAGLRQPNDRLHDHLGGDLLTCDRQVGLKRNIVRESALWVELRSFHLEIHDHFTRQPARPPLVSHKPGAAQKYSPGTLAPWESFCTTGRQSFGLHSGSDSSGGCRTSEAGHRAYPETGWVAALPARVSQLLSSEFACQPL